MNTFKKLRAQKKAAVIDKDFTLSDDEITVIRDLHKRIGESFFDRFVVSLTFAK